MESIIDRRFEYLLAHNMIPSADRRQGLELMLLLEVILF